MRTLDLAIGAPWVGMVPGDENPCTLHAVTMEALVGSLTDQVMVTPCGEPGVKVLPFPLGSENPAPWPPPATMPAPFTRCPACWVATGKKRPACKFVKRDKSGGRRKE